jgi:HSP20 family protein
MFLVPMSRHANDLARSFDRLFDDSTFERFFAPSRAEGDGARSPALDVTESDRAYTVKVDLPGITKDDVKIAIDGRRVDVQAQTARHEDRKDGDRVLYSERAVSSWARSFTLPAEVDQSESSARMDHGVLTLTLAKRGANRATQLTVS